MTFLDWWQLNVAPVLMQPEAAGTAGSLLSLRWAPGKTWGTRAFALGSGFGLTLYIMPGVAQFYGVQHPRYLLALGFFFGFGGPYILAAAADFLREVRWREMIAMMLKLQRANGDDGPFSGGPPRRKK